MLQALRAGAMLVVAVLLLPGCAGAGTPETGSAPSRTQSASLTEPTSSAAPSDGASPTTGGSDVDDPVAQARADLAGRVDVEPEAIEVVTREEVTWRSGALGCPEPDKMYTQALVPGYRIVLQAGGARFDYHGAADEPPFLCERPERSERPARDAD